MSGRVPRVAFSRLLYSRAFDSVCNIERNGQVIAENIPCIVGVPNDRTQVLDGQTIPVGGFLVGVPVNYRFQNGDYVVEKGRLLRIILTTSPKSYQIRTEGYALDVGEAPT